MANGLAMQYPPYCLAYKVRALLATMQLAIPVKH